MPLAEITIDELIHEHEYYIECKIGKTTWKYKGTFSHIVGIQCAIFINPLTVTSTGFKLETSTGFIRMFRRWGKIFHKTSDTIRRKVENQHEYVYEAALQKVTRDIFCPTIHYNENGAPIYDENGLFLNYKDVILNMCITKQTKIK
jgi:hypothetical protein